MSSNLPAYNIFHYFCTTENKYIFEQRPGIESPPTICKNDGGAISNVYIYQKIAKLNGPLLSINGNTTSEISPNYIDFNSQFYNVSDYGNGISKVLLKVDDTTTSSDVLWSSNKINDFVGSSTTKSQVELYNVNPVIINSTSYKDINNLDERYIDDNFSMVSDIGVHIVNPGIYHINAKINFAVTLGKSISAATFTYRLVSSTDGINYNELPGNSNTQLTISKSSSNSNTYASVLPVIYNQTSMNHYIKMQAKLSNVTASCSTVPAATGITIFEI